ncbi:MAG: acyltransferase [Gammaproteobacteria bacterium]|nr:acyltransferase [Gammaproteobacteria bacterium]
MPNTSAVAQANSAVSAIEPATLSQRLPALDGLRGLAILMVVMHNLSPLSQPHGAVSYLLAVWLDHGWIGVPLFFALSGFLITGILLDTRAAPNYFKSFFARRALRIFPLYYATLFVMFVVLPIFNLWHRISPSELWSVVYLSNWVQPFHPREFSLPHFWSLAVEEQFYLLWPFVVYRLGTRQVLKLSLIVAALALVIRLVLLYAGFSHDALYQFSVCRMDALALGAAAAAALRLPVWRERLVGRQQQLLWVCIAVLALGAPLSHLYQQFGFLPQSIGYTFIAIGSCLLVLTAACADLSGAAGWWSRLLRNTLLRRLALYSYAMYVLHIPLQEIIARPLARAYGWENHSSLWGTLIYIVAGTVVSYCVAALSYHAFERHFLRLKRYFAAAN